MAEIPRPKAEVTSPLFEDDLLRQLAESLNETAQKEEEQPQPEAEAPVEKEQTSPEPPPQPAVSAGVETPTAYLEENDDRGHRVHGKVDRGMHTKALRSLVLGRINETIEEEIKNMPPEPVKPVKGGTASLYEETAPHKGRFALQKKDSDETYEVGKFLRVGRDPKYATLIPEGNTTISQKHAELYEKGGLLLVKDVGTHGDGSQNGTFINGNRIPAGISVEVIPGDVVKFSNEEYIVLAIE